MQQNEKKYKDQLDDFSKLIKQRLEDHRMPVDEDSWNAIEQRIKPVNNRRTMWWTIAAVSYTHLDVYKRQACVSGAYSFCLITRFFSTSLSGFSLSGT